MTTAQANHANRYKINEHAISSNLKPYGKPSLCKHRSRFRHPVYSQHRRRSSQFYESVRARIGGSGERRTLRGTLRHDKSLSVFHVPVQAPCTQPEYIYEHKLACLTKEISLRTCTPREHPSDLFSATLFPTENGNQKENRGKRQSRKVRKKWVDNSESRCDLFFPTVVPSSCFFSTS